MYCKFYTIENRSGLNMKQIIGILLAAACVAGGEMETTGQETQEPETLEVRYIQSGTSYTNQVAKDVKVLRFDFRITSLTLPEGLTKLHTLEIDWNNGINLPYLELPKDIGKEADWPFQLMLYRPITLRVHRAMGHFSLWARVNARGNGLGAPTRIPSAEDLIRNREPDDDGVFRIPMNYDFHHQFQFSIEVHGIAPRIWLTRQEDGVEIIWEAGPLQSAPTINGPWKDITFDDTRRLFLRSSSPAEFFRVKPMAEDESTTETQQSTPSKTPRQTPHFLLRN